MDGDSSQHLAEKERYPDVMQCVERSKQKKTLIKIEPKEILEQKSTHDELIKDDKEIEKFETISKQQTVQEEKKKIGKKVIRFEEKAQVHEYRNSSSKSK